MTLITLVPNGTYPAGGPDTFEQALPAGTTSVVFRVTCPLQTFFQLHIDLYTSSDNGAHWPPYPDTQFDVQSRATDSTVTVVTTGKNRLRAVVTRGTQITGQVTATTTP
jgi:hypothetical protein